MMRSLPAVPLLPSSRVLLPVWHEDLARIVSHQNRRERLKKRSQTSFDGITEHRRRRRPRQTFVPDPQRDGEAKSRHDNCVCAPPASDAGALSRKFVTPHPRTHAMS